METSEEIIRQAMGRRWGQVPALVLGETDSTNTRLKEWARAGKITAPFLLAADSQSAGRGRLGRRFVSPPGTGLYMSLLIDPPEDADTGKITVLAAVAVCQAIEACTGLQPKIKWVNDLFLGGKKVCGILAERVGGSVVVGMGVNLKTPIGGFPPEAAIAGALDADVDRFTLAGTIARHYLDGLERLDTGEAVTYYRAHMPLIGREIRYTQSGQEKNALVTGVADDGGLMIRDDTGDHILRTGEVSLGSQSFTGLL
ncbi:MAG: biotin--[Clostridia bacterium]|nr:biotin--[acetyl-CoA-carboxylase] ligase [Clostridia bacterium]